MGGLVTKVLRHFLCRAGLLVNASVRKLVADRGGSTIIVFAVTLPILLAAAGAALDFGRLSGKRAAFQSAADAAALAAASDLFVVTTSNLQATSVAKQVAVSNLEKTDSAVAISTVVTDDPPAVTVTVSEDVELYFGDILHAGPTKRVSASATAQVVGSTRICVLSLDGKTQGGVSVETKARLTGNGCAVYSNSLSSQSIVAKNSALVEASLTCAAGGINGDEHFNPKALSDCPAIPDPLADRPAPPIGGCTAKWLYITKSTTLSPGVYCGGIEIGPGAHVFFNPGVYIIKDGALMVDDGAVLEGVNVGFYLTGSKATFNFWAQSTISLTAPKDGPLAGLLFFEDKARKTAGTHYIKSNDARLLLGTIYLPASNLVVDAKSPIADQSAYTAIIVRSLKLYDGPHLILNTDYGSTDIPVPKGVKGTGNAVALVE